jgi:hypothetical protein
MNLQKLYFNMLREGITILSEAKHQVDKEGEKEAMRITIDNLEELVNKLPIHLVSKSFTAEQIETAYDVGFCDGCEEARPAY